MLPREQATRRLLPLSLPLPQNQTIRSIPLRPSRRPPPGHPPPPGRSPLAPSPPPRSQPVAARSSPRSQPVAHDLPAAGSSAPDLPSAESPAHDLPAAGSACYPNFKETWPRSYANPGSATGQVAADWIGLLRRDLGFLLSLFFTATTSKGSPRPTGSPEPMEDNILVSSKIHGRSKGAMAKRAHVEDKSIPIANYNKLNCILCGKHIIKRRRTHHNFQKITRRHLNYQKTKPRQLNFQSLPEDIVLKIMSELTLKEAAQLSVLSSNWKQAWTFHPNLYFDIKTVLGSNAKRKGTSSDLNCGISNVNKFIKRVDAILEKHCGTMVNKFAVKFGLSNEHANHVNGWVAFAIASKAKVITLDFSPDWKSDENNYDFPCHIFNKHNGSYLEELRLDSVTLNTPLDFCGFSNLKMLALDYVRLQHLQQLISKCHVLEWLRIQSCSQLHNLHVSNPLCRLHYLSIKDCHLQRMELHAPNLTIFEYKGSLALVTLNECSKLKTSAIELPSDDALKYILTEIPTVLPHVETLHVEVYVKTQMSGFTQLPLKFTQLKHLTMDIIFGRGPFGGNSVFQLAYLLEAAPLLEDLCLDMYCGYCCLLDLNDIVDHHHHHLRMVCIYGFCGNTGQVELAKYILKNALILEKMIIDPKGSYRSHGYFGREEAEEKLVPEDRNGVLRIM